MIYILIYNINKKITDIRIQTQHSISKIKNICFKKSYFSRLQGIISGYDFSKNNKKQNLIQLTFYVFFLAIRGL